MADLFRGLKGRWIAESGTTGYLVPGAGMVQEVSEAVALDAISVTDIAQWRVFEGAAGSASVTISGTHTGATDTIQVQIETTGGAVVSAWQTLQSAVVAGAFSGTITVPRGGWYFARVRKATQPLAADLQATEWGVGYIVGGFGQSQVVGFVGDGTGTPDSRVVIHDGTSFSPMTSTGQGRNAMGAALAAAANCPVCVILHGVSNTSIFTWYNAPTKGFGYNTWESRVTAAGGKLSAFVLWQGERDANDGVSNATYRAAIDAVFARIRTDYGASLPVVIMELGRSSTGVDAAMEAIRDAHVAAGGATNNRSVTTFDQPTSDGVHFTAAACGVLGLRMAQAFAHAYGHVAYYRGPRITSAARAGAQIVDVILSHGGGTDITPTSGITAFSVLDDGSPVTISSAVRQGANVIRLTLATAPTGAVTVRHGYGSNPTVTGIVKDNSTLALPLQTTDADVLAAGRKVLLNCIQRVGGAAAASITGLRWAFFDQSAPNALTAPVVTGTGESTDASGVLEIDVIGTTLNVGDTGYLVTDTAAGIGFCGPVVVSG